MPSSRGRGWCCSAAARLQPPVAGRPARTAPGLVRPCLSRTRARRRGRARRSPAPRGREGPLSSNVDREHGRARVALDRSGVRARTREQEGPSCSAMPTAPPADPRRRVRLRARVCYAREDGECSRVRPSDVCARWVRRSAPAALARGPLELDPPAFLAWALSLLGAWGRPACARYAPTSLSCARTARLAGGTSSGTSVGGFACLCGTRLFALWLCTLSLAVAVCL